MRLGPAVAIERLFDALAEGVIRPLRAELAVDFKRDRAVLGVVGVLPVADPGRVADGVVAIDRVFTTLADCPQPVVMFPVAIDGVLAVDALFGPITQRVVAVAIALALGRSGVEPLLRVVAVAPVFAIGPDPRDLAVVVIAIDQARALAAIDRGDLAGSVALERGVFIVSDPLSVVFLLSPTPYPQLLSEIRGPLYPLEPVHNPIKIPIYRGMRKTYPSDISREQFEHVRPDLDNLRRKTRPRTVDLYDVFCAVLYVLISGCQWRMLPGDFPKWRTVYYYWDQWSRRSRRGSSPLDRAFKKIGSWTIAKPTAASL